MEKEQIIQEDFFNSDNIRAVDAIERAQLIAFAPFVWEASKLLIEQGILSLLEKNQSKGLSIDTISEKIDMSHYGVRVLLEAGLGIGLVYRKEQLYFLAKTGHFLLNNELTKVNYNFMRDVCAKGSSALEKSIKNSQPEGLKTIGNWKTLYEGLSSFPPHAKQSWLDFDHFYSDHTFEEILPIIFNLNPQSILDIGGNTGKWTLQCLNYSDDVRMGIIDLPGQLKMAEENINTHGFEGRVDYFPIDVLLENSQFPKNFDIIWMSQFLDCFSDEQIISILKKCHDAANEETSIFINETFWDRQKHRTSAFSLQMTSLYFTTIANGNSQMYDSQVFYKLIDQAGFKIVNEYDHLGYSHTLIELKKK